MSAKEKTFWPNDETFSHLFRLLVATNPKDVGQRGELLLSKIEIRRAMAALDDGCHSIVQIPLSTYHRVLRCWLESAKANETTEYNSVCAKSALKVIEKLDIQATPFLMSDSETRLPSVPRYLYDTQLRPTRQTYRLAAHICRLAIRHDDEAVDIAFTIYDKLRERNMLVDSDFENLSSSVAELPDDSDKKTMFQARLSTIQDERSHASKSGSKSLAA